MNFTNLCASVQIFIIDLLLILNEYIDLCDAVIP